ncbi:hypothetical protein MG293_013513 [Ovis ammon polii]|uniref:Scavenger receptor class B member 2 n=1 Tax=Ovis ammon polii TaxID=230172 RepID=A0AAD4TZ84_OVIAM|nr:hypothetical protein MG293_013513 [Ovis ammon polii]
MSQTMPSICTSPTALGHGSSQRNIVLRNGSETFDSWKKSPLPVYTQFYFFNVTNPEEILNGETPWLEEVGPYTYRELRNKDKIQFGDNGTTISAVSNKAYVFERDKSVGDPKIDLLRTINIPALTAMEWSQLPLLRELIEALLKAYRQKLFVTHTVDELLWGYKDEILSLISVFKHDVSPYFGLFYGKNGTNDGDYVFLTGEDNYLNFSKIVEWNGKTSLDWWTADECNMINGTDEKFVSAIEGMQPNKEYHETFVDINPLTGVILRAAKRFQINVYVRKLDDFIETGNIQTLVFLVMYINESVLIDKETASRLKSVINTTLIVTNIPYIIMALGVFFGLIFTWLACRGQGSTDEGTADERAPLIRT